MVWGWGMLEESVNKEDLMVNTWGEMRSVGINQMFNLSII
jgi:hypothetical protein